MRHTTKAAGTILGGAVLAAVGTVLAAPAAFAETPCPGAAGAGPVIVCTSVTTATVPVPLGGQTIVVGGQTVGPYSGGTVNVPSQSVSTPTVPVTSPTQVCYVLDCIDPGQTLLTVPGQNVSTPPQSVPVPVNVPAVTLPSFPVTIPASVTVPVPNAYLYDDPTAETVQEALDTVNRNQYVRTVMRIVDDPLSVYDTVVAVAEDPNGYAQRAACTQARRADNTTGLQTADLICS